MQFIDKSWASGRFGTVPVVLAASLLGCSVDAATVGAGGASSGSGGAAGGSAGTTVTAGAAALNGGAGMSMATNGEAGNTPAGGGRSASAGMGGVPSMSGDGPTSGGSAGSGGSKASTGGAISGGIVDAWYEAEAPENEIDNGTERGKCAKTCDTVVDKASCCSAGGELRQLLGRGGTNNAGGGVTFKHVMVPSDGVYDVTWWYHCGLYDNWHDHNCGGAPYPAWLMSFYDPTANPQPGCRPHLIAVNGVLMDGPDHKTPFWQFPCFGGSWEVMHVATTPLLLKAGENQIRLGAPHIADLDAVDIDAIHVVTAGKGVSPVVPEGRAIAGDDGRK